jgi:hypothetical protein
MSRAEPRTDQFVDVSALLTGFGRFELLGTGLAGRYLSALDGVLPEGVLDELLDAFERLPAGPGQTREAAVRSQILGHPKLGPVARNLILMWYCGTWTALPAAWREAHGASPLDTSHVVSAEAYQGGLQWATAGAHPAGARQQGFAAWTTAPQAAARQAVAPESVAPESAALGKAGR